MNVLTRSQPQSNNHRAAVERSQIQPPVTEVDALARYTTVGIAVRLFLTCWLIYSLHFATNVVREIYPALSLAEHASFDVSDYLGLHPDIFELPGHGVFINNNPGASILGALPYLLSRPLVDRVVAYVQNARQTNGSSPPDYDTVYPNRRKFLAAAWERGLDVKLGLAAGVMQTFMMAPLSAISVVVMFFVLRTTTRSDRAALWLAILYAFATPIFYRTAFLNQNLLQAHFTLFAFVLLWQPWAPGRRIPGWHYLLAGLFTGWTVVLDYSGLIIVAALGLYLLAKYFTRPQTERSPSELVLFGLGVGVTGLFLIAYQWLHFGHPIWPAQHYMPETRYSGEGYQGMSLPQLDLLLELAVGIRYGLFASAPLLLLALVVPLWLRRRSGWFDRSELIFIILFTGCFFIFTSANQFARMQFNTGVRHIMPVVPFVFLLSANVLYQLPAMVAVMIGIGTTYWSWCLAMYRDVELGLGVFESLLHVTFEGFRLPWLTTIGLMGYFDGVSALPMLVLVAVIIFALWFIPLKLDRPKGL